MLQEAPSIYFFKVKVAEKIFGILANLYFPSQLPCLQSIGFDWTFFRVKFGSTSCLFLKLVDKYLPLCLLTPK